MTNLARVGAAAAIVAALTVAARADTILDYASNPSGYVGPDLTTESYHGAQPPGAFAGSDVVSNAPTNTSSAFEIKRAEISLVDQTLTIEIYSNYVAGTLSTAYGDLFLTSAGVAGPGGHWNPIGTGPNYDADRLHTDGTGSIWDYVVALDNPLVAVGSSTNATVYALSGNNTDIKTSYASGGFRQYQPVQYDGSGGQAVVGTTATFAVASTGQSAGSLDGQYKYTITITNFDLLTGLDPTHYAMSWAMTCANDVIQGFVSTPNEITRPVPLPGALPLLVSGLFGVGALGRWRRNRSES